MANHRVSVSARLIRWPDRCACCCGPADTSETLTATRTSGVRVVRTEEKAWRVPYCRLCQRHIRAAWDVREKKKRGRLERPQRPAPRPLPPEPFPWHLAVIILAAFAVLAVLGAVVGLMALGPVHPIAWAAITVAGVVLATLIGVGAWRACWHLHAWQQEEEAGRRKQIGKLQAADERDWQAILAEYDADRQELEREMRRAEAKVELALGCSCIYDVAAAYLGWYGSVHTFEFTSSRYASEFREANAGKVVL